MTIFVLSVGGQLIHLSVMLIADHFVFDLGITVVVSERVHVVALGLLGVVVHGVGKERVRWADRLIRILMVIVGVLTGCHLVDHVVRGVGCG